MDYLFILGNAPDLAREEIKAVLLRFEIQGNFTLYHAPIFGLSLSANLPQEVLKTLGGTVKVSQVVSKFNHFTEDIQEPLISDIVTTLEKSGQPSVNFGLSLMGQKQGSFGLISHLSKTIKKNLQDQGIKARFVLPRDQELELSSVVVTKQKLTEFVIVFETDQTILSQTIWVQDFEDWSKRDYGRPEAQGHIGMLPPKVARMMVNLGGRGPLLDPFCGVGTILTEALTLRFEVIGLDSNSDQVKRSQANLDWFKKIYSVNSSSKLYLGDARQTDKIIGNVKVASIVTEPDLGPNTTQNINSKQLADLEKLYLDCLTNWKNILEPSGRVVIALPSFVISGNSFPIHLNSILVQEIIDKAKIMGYSLLAGPLEYSRPQAKVRRNICVFQK